MADRPIPFSAPMVRALLDGRKTQTRRVLRPRPEFLGGYGEEADYEEWGWIDEDGAPMSVLDVAPNGYVRGDRLLVREAWRAWVDFDELPPRDIPPGADVQYLADDPLSPWTSRYRHARFMPRWASRLTLTVTDVRVERLRDISEADAVAEGVEAGATSRGTMWRAYGEEPNCWVETARASFIRLWNSLHGPGAWDANPWVAAISFDVRRGNIDEVPK